MMWLNFLHFYQPGTADSSIIKQAVNLSYNRLTTIYLENKKLKATINIAGCLLDRLQSMGEIDLLNKWRELVKRGQWELTGTAMYHPILPLLSIDEVERQIKINSFTLAKYFGHLNLNGFYFPEMAYSPALGKFIKKIGYKWTVLDPIAKVPHKKQKELNLIEAAQVDRYSGLTIIFRDRELSNNYPPKSILTMSVVEREKQPIITATDVELYGLRHFDRSGWLEKLLQSPWLKTETFSNYLSTLSRKFVVDLRSASWETVPADLNVSLPFRLWQDPKNEIQKNLWQLAYLAQEALKKFPNDKNFFWARQHLDYGLASCAWWWASGRLVGVNKTLAWHPDETEKGALQLVKSIRSLKSTESLKYKLKAEKIYSKLLTSLWHKHWQRFWSLI